MTRHPLFGEYADIYAEADYLDFTKDVAAALPGVWSSYGIQPSRLLDLACGSGILLAHLAPLLESTVGVDSSPRILAHARTLLEGSGAHTELHEVDIRDFVADRPADVVTCTYNTLNYLTSAEDLALTFANAFASTTPGGIFVCDLHPRSFVENVLAGGVFVETDTVDMFECWQNPIDDDGVLLTSVNIFRRDSSGTWSRIKEEHPTLGHDVEPTVASLRGVGYTEVDVVGDLDLSPVGTDPERNWFIARRPR